MKPTNRELLDRAADHLEELILTMDGYDDAIIGIDEGGRAVYSRMGIIECLQNMGMDATEAEEFYEFNVARSLPYYGTEAPLVVALFSDLAD